MFPKTAGHPEAMNEYYCRFVRRTLLQPEIVENQCAASSNKKINGAAASRSEELQRQLTVKFSQGLLLLPPLA
ncbi:MAG: hypothetical protein P8130_04530 [Deltaproteobacteria bacterium]